MTRAEFLKTEFSRGDTIVCDGKRFRFVELKSPYTPFVTIEDDSGVYSVHFKECIHIKKTI